jgi:hypothetical protein
LKNENNIRRSLIDTHKIKAGAASMPTKGHERREKAALTQGKMDTSARNEENLETKKNVFR